MVEKEDRCPINVLKYTYIPLNICFRKRVESLCLNHIFFWGGGAQKIIFLVLKIAFIKDTLLEK